MVIRMERPKILFVFNPRSGKAKIKNKLCDIIDIFVKAPAHLGGPSSGGISAAYREGPGGQTAHRFGIQAGAGPVGAVSNKR